MSTVDPGAGATPGVSPPTPPSEPPPEPTGEAKLDISKDEAKRQRAQREPRFTVERLRSEGADVLVEHGYTNAEVVAALHGHEEDEELTREAAAKLVAEALERPVQHDDAPTDEPEE